MKILFALLCFTALLCYSVVLAAITGAPVGFIIILFYTLFAVCLIPFHRWSARSEHPEMSQDEMNNVKVMSLVDLTGPRHPPSKMRYIQDIILMWTVVGIPAYYLKQFYRFTFIYPHLDKDTERQFRQFTGNPELYSISHEGPYRKGGSGRKSGVGASTGIAYENGILFVFENGYAMKVPIDKVRKWSSHFSDPSTSERGLFIRVESTSYPKWHFQTNNVQEADRWIEIIKQASEGAI